MDIKHQSIVDTIIEYANIKFGVELNVEEVSKQLKNMSFQETLKVVDSIKNENDDLFSDLIDMSAVNEGYKILPPMDKEKYQARDGLEGPFSTLSGKVVYYDPKEGKYYDPDTDMYLSYDEFQQYDNDYSGMKQEAISPTASTISAQRPQGTADKNAARDEQNAAIRANRSTATVQRTVAGSAKKPTGQASRPAPDLDGQQRDDNTAQAEQNAKDIERLKQLALGKR